MLKIISNFIKSQLYSLRLFPLAFAGNNNPCKFLKIYFRQIGKFDLYFSKKGKASYPNLVILQPTSRCNLRCKGCRFFGENGVYLSRDDNLIEKEMSLTEMKGVIDDISSFVSMVIITGGGEPFVRPDLIDLIEHIKSKKIFCIIVTNGTLLDREITERLIRCKLDVMIFSIDGLKDVHEELRGVKGIFNGIMSNLQMVSETKNARKSKYPLLQINYTLFQENYTIIRNFTEYISKIPGFDIDILNFRHTSYLEKEDAFLNKDIVKEKFGMDSDQIMAQVISNVNIEPKKLIKEMNFLKKEGHRYKFKIFFQPELNGREELYYKSNYKSRKKICYRPWYQAFVDPDGNVQCCNDIFFGNIRTASLKDIWNNGKATSLRKFLKKNTFPSCKRCCS